ncbi:hypothetical protein GCM10010123_16220 [Pilimelia anulata]|uniref:Uncharacterized protein n=1 Tax=Pilimelia anulata TaxID=53371 RepID=A0A8J3F8I8_9ACTN|nr:hypothetical protein [Pilimelia anulata]GGJ87377.1 hypothetical protein GCM10010123_16220 [Pilimelia anulata]
MNPQLTINDSVELIDRWTRTEFTALNRAILGGTAAPESLTDRFHADLVPLLPEPDGLPPLAARQLVVLLGLVGAAIARYRQERDPCPPEHSFEGVDLGGPDFAEWFARIAERTGAGHPPRDSYTSLVRWNVPRCEVTWQGLELAAIDGCFPDNRIRTYTGAAGEESFFELVKQGETLERAVNLMLAPIASGELDFAGAETLCRLGTATALLDVLRRLLGDFPHLPPATRMTADQFMDIFRQFAVHWRTGDLPPSGAFDTEALQRDFLLGMGYPHYRDGVRRLYPGLLADERDELDVIMDRPSLPERLLAGLGVPPGGLDALTPDGRDALVAAHPELIPWFGLLQAHARLSSAHLGLTKRMLFNPQRAREVAELAGNPVVNNSTGTTGMTERYLLELTRHRRDHALLALREAVVGRRPAAPAAAPPQIVVSVAGRSVYS